MTSDQKKILNFIKEIDKFKEVNRKTHINGGKRVENDVEHSWHLTMMVWFFASFYEKRINLGKTIRMALIHDLVEIYTGDVFAFDHQKRLGKPALEQKAAKKLYKMLPKYLEDELLKLWQEFEENKTEEAKFVQALDKLHPIIQNLISEGKSWQENKVTEEMIRKYKTKFNEGSLFLMELFNYLLKTSKKKGYLS